MRPHKRQPTRLLCPWDSPGKNTGVGCHFLLQCMKVKSESEVAQSCPTLSDPMDWRLPGSSIHGIFQARVLGWGATATPPQLGEMKSQLRALSSQPPSFRLWGWSCFQWEGKILWRKDTGGRKDIVELSMKAVLPPLWIHFLPHLL